MKYLLSVLLVLLLGTQIIFGMPTPAQENDYQDYEHSIGEVRCSAGFARAPNGRCVQLIGIQTSTIDYTSLFDQ